MRYVPVLSVRAPEEIAYKNGWIDKEGRVYVFYTIRTIKESMRCANTKACGLLKELDAFGLTERKKQGQMPGIFAS